MGSWGNLSIDCVLVHTHVLQKLLLHLREVVRPLQEKRDGQITEADSGRNP